MDTIDMNLLDAVVGGLEPQCTRTRAGATAYTLSSKKMPSPSGSFFVKECRQVLPNGNAQDYQQFSLPRGSDVSAELPGLRSPTP